MATISDKALIDRIIKDEGYDRTPLAEGERPDPRVVKIVEYNTPEGGTAWGVTWETERDHTRYDTETHFVRNPRTIWEAKPGVHRGQERRSRFRQEGPLK